MYVLKLSKRFRRDYRLCVRRGLDAKKLEIVLNLLAAGSELPPQYKDHPLKNELKGYRDLHIDPDWLLIYKYCDDSIILLFATGTHSDLFK